MSEEIGMYINVRAKGIAQADNELEKLANTAENAEKKAQKLGMTFDSYNKTLKGLQSVAKAAGASQDVLASSNLRVSQTANTLVDANGNVIASLKRMSDTAQQAGMGMGDYFKRLESMKRSAYTAGMSQKELANSYLTVTQGAYHLTNANGDIVRSLSRTKDGMKSAAEEANRLNQVNGSLTNSFDVLKAAITGYLSIQTAKKIVGMADSMTILNNQIKLVTNSHEEAREVQSELINISNSTFASLESTTKLYTRTARAMSAYNKTQKEVLDFTESINNAMRIGGVNATEQASALLQLSQALGSGRLQGDEFRSISEAAPILLDYISQYMGVARSELKKLGSEGKITGDIIFNAMSQAGEGLKEMTKGLPVTFEQSLVTLRNESMSLADEWLNGTGVIQGLTNTVGFLANNLNVVLVPAGLLGVAMAGKLTTSLIVNSKAFWDNQYAAAKASLGLTNYSAVAKLATASSATLNIATKGLGVSLSLLGGPIAFLSVAAIGFDVYSSMSKKATAANYSMMASTGQLGSELKKLDSIFLSLNKNQQDLAISKQQNALSGLIQRAVELRKEIGHTQTEIHKMSYKGTFGNWFGTTTSDKNEAQRALNEMKSELMDIEEAIKSVSGWLDKVLGKNSNEETFSGKYLEEFDAINKKFLEIGLNQQELNNLKYDEWLLSGQIKDFERDNLRLMNEQAFAQLALNNAREKGIKALESINDRYEKIGMSSMQAEIHDIKKLGLSGPKEDEAIRKIEKIYANKSSGGGRSDPFTDRLKSLSQELSSLQAMNIEYAKYGDISKYTAAKELTLEFENQSSALYKVSHAQKAVLILQAQSLDSQKQLNEILMLSNDYSKDLSDMEFEISLIGQTQKAIEQLTFSRDLEKRVKELSIGMSAENIAKLQEETAGILQQKAAVESLRAIKENDVLGGIGDGVRKSIEEAGTVRDQWAEASKFAFDSMADSFASFASGTKKSFSEMTESIVQDIAKMMIKMSIMNAMKIGLEGTSFGAILGFSGGGKADGGIVGMPYRIGSLAESGGYTGIGGKYEEADIVHKGEVVFSQRDVANHGGVAAVENMRLRGYAGGGVVGGLPARGSTMGMTVNIHNNSSAKVETRQGTDSNGMPSLDVFINQVASEIDKRISNGGSTAKILQGKYGLRTQAR